MDLMCNYDSNSGYSPVKDADVDVQNVVAPQPVLQLPGPGPLEEPKDEENQEKPADQYETMASILQDLEAEDEENQEKPKKKEDWRFWRFLREREIFKKKIIMTILFIY